MTGKMLVQLRARFPACNKRLGRRVLDFALQLFLHDSTRAESQAKYVGAGELRLAPRLKKRFQHGAAFITQYAALKLRMMI